MFEKKVNPMEAVLLFPSRKFDSSFNTLCARVQGRRKNELRPLLFTRPGNRKPSLTTAKCSEEMLLLPRLVYGQTKASLVR